MAGEEKFGYFRLSEGTEGEDGSLSSGCGWLEVLCVWRWELTANCSSFICEESGEVISYYRSGGGGQRRESNVLKRLRVSGALLILLWKYDDLAVWTSAEKDESKDWSKKTTQVWLIFWFAPFSLLPWVRTDVHEEHQITRSLKGQFVLAWRREDKCRLDKSLK